MQSDWRSRAIEVTCVLLLCLQPVSALAQQAPSAPSEPTAPSTQVDPAAPSTQVPDLAARIEELQRRLAEQEALNQHQQAELDAARLLHDQDRTFHVHEAIMKP